jgi:hypothetical protein
MCNLSNGWGKKEIFASLLAPEDANRGWMYVGYGMEMDSYKYRISDGVLMGSGSKKISYYAVCMRQCLNWFITKRTHSCVAGLNGEALFLELLRFFCCECQ